MLTLFHAPRSRSSRLLWLLEELGADYTLHHVSIRYLDNSGRGPDAANPHPDKKVPALLHDGVLVSESTAVALYVCELMPSVGLAPAAGDPARGAFLTWLVWSDTEFAPAVFGRMSGAADPAAANNYEAAVRRLTEALAQRPFLLGDRFTAADVMVGASLRFFRPYLPDNPAFDSYLVRLAERPAFRRMQMKDAPAAASVA